MNEYADGPVIVVGYTAPMQYALDLFQPADSVIFVDEPDVAIGRGAPTHLPSSTSARGLINEEYQLPGAADAFYHRYRDLAPSAVIPGMEYAVPFTARLAERYRVPGAGLGAAQILRDKSQVRTVTGAAGIANPVSRAVGGPAELRAFMAEQDGPVVLKPANRQASVGTMILHDVAEADAAWAECVVQDEGFVVPGRGLPLRMIAEQYVSGAEFSVEMMVRAGEPVFGNVTGKVLYPGPRPVELGHLVPAEIPTELTQRLLAETAAVLAAVGFGTGFAHCEWIVPPDGTPYLVECAGRMPGDGIIELIQRAWRFDIVEEYIRMMRGLPLRQPLPERAPAGAAVWFLHVEPGEVLSVDGVAAAQAVPDVVTVSVTAKPGGRVNELRSSWDRIALVTACSATPSEALERAKQAIAQISVTVLPDRMSA